MSKGRRARCPVISEFAAYDLAAALGMTSDSGTRYLARALEIRYRLPKIWAAVLTGRLPVWKAGRVAETTMVLSKAGAAYVDSRLGQAIARISFAQVERLVEEALARFDPVELEARRVKAAESRRVIIDLTDTSIEGTTNLYATLDLADATDLDDALRAAATALAAAGSTESLDVRRSIALGDLARGQSSLEFSTAGAGRELVVHLHHDSPHVARCETTRAPITVEQIKTWCATSTTKITIKPVIDLNQHIPPSTAPELVAALTALSVTPDLTRGPELVEGRGLDLGGVRPTQAGPIGSTPPREDR